MKKNIFRGLCILLCAFCLPLSIHAAEKSESTDSGLVHTVLWTGQLYVEGEPVGFWDSAGNRRTPLAYQDTVYIPLHTAGLWMGAKVTWDPNTSAVAFTTGQAKPAYPGLSTTNFVVSNTSEMSAYYNWNLAQGAEAQLRPDIQIFIDSEPQSFMNTRGEPVYPLLFEKCLYLPVRSIGEFLGKHVLWHSLNDGTSRIYLFEPITPEQYKEASILYHFEARSYVEQLRQSLAMLENDSSLEGLDLRNPTLQEKFAELKLLALSINKLSPPTFSTFLPHVEQINLNVIYLVDIDLSRYVDPDTYMSSEYSDLGWNWHRKHFFQTLRSDINALDEELQDLRTLITEVQFSVITTREAAC